MTDQRERRPWKPVSKKRLDAIREDTGKDNPVCDYCAAEVYDMACEIISLRAASKGVPAEMTEGVRPNMRKVALYLKYIAHVLERGA
jgi:hypothetical protein